jgi:hypothetical protein
VRRSVFGHAQLWARRSPNRGWGAGAHNCRCDFTGRAVTVTSGEQRPPHPCVLVGQGDRGHLRSARGAEAPRPPTTRVARALSARGARPVDQPGAQRAVPALGDPAQHGLAARARRARHPPQLGTHLASIPEARRITHCGHQRSSGQRTHPRHRGQPDAALVLLKLASEPRRAARDALLERPQPVAHLAQQLPPLAG